MQVITYIDTELRNGEKLHAKRKEVILCIYIFHPSDKISVKKQILNFPRVI